MTETFACPWCPGDGRGDHAIDCAKRETHPLDPRLVDFTGHMPIAKTYFKCSESGCGRELTVLPEGGFEHFEGWREQGEREERERRVAEKAAIVAVWETGIPYTGAITRCQNGLSQPRGAPYRCFRKPVRVILTKDAHTVLSGKPIAVCSPCGHSKHGCYPYTGWGGDPHPVIEPLEEEYLR